MRLSYLYGIVDEMYLVGTDVYVGGDNITDDAVEDVYGKLYHYNGLYSVDLSDYSSITADGGDSGSSDGDSDSSVSTDHYRSGSVEVSSGSAVVSFSSPLSTTDYHLDAYVLSSSGYKQTNLDVSSKTKNGFAVSDILEGGTLHYFAVVNV
ncbi:MAG: hypothetical protein R6U17_06300, partial [Thermoplasmata archaeon]